MSSGRVDGDAAVELRRDDLLVVRILAVDEAHRDRDVAAGHLELIALRAERADGDLLAAARLRAASASARDGTMNFSVAGNTARRGS